MATQIVEFVERLRDSNWSSVRETLTRLSTEDSQTRVAVLRGLSLNESAHRTCHACVDAQGERYEIFAPHAVRIALTLQPDQADRGPLELRVSRDNTLQDLMDLPSLNQLELLELDAMTELRSLNGLSTATGLHTLYLSACENLQDISEIGQLARLRTLGLSGCGTADGGLLEDISFLNSLSELSRLALSDLPAYAHGLNGWHSAGHDALFPTLEELELTHFQGYDLSPMDNAAAELIVQSIRALDLSYSPQLVSVDGLLATDVFDAIKEADERWWSEQDATRPESPRRWSRAYFERMLPVLEERELTSWARPQLTQLRALRLRECRSLSDIDCLQMFPHLKQLDLSFTGITSASALLHLDQLESVDLRGCEKLEPAELRIQFEGTEACNDLKRLLLSVEEDPTT